jgi:hypothetical protein
MDKQEKLNLIRPYCQEQIPGVLIEILLPEKIALYERLEMVVGETMEANRASILEAFDWDIGESRWRNAYLVHLWSDAVDLDSFEDFDRCYSAEELAELHQFLLHLTRRLSASLSDIAGVAILPTLEANC